MRRPPRWQMESSCSDTKVENPIEVDQKVRLSRNQGGYSTDRRAPAWLDQRRAAENEKRPRNAEPSSPFGAGNEIRTHDFNLGNPCRGLNTIREIQQHQPQVSRGVACRPDMSRGVPRKVEDLVEDLGATLRGLQPDWAGNCSPASNDVRSKTGPFSIGASASVGHEGSANTPVRLGRGHGGR